MELISTKSDLVYTGSAGIDSAHLSMPKPKRKVKEPLKNDILIENSSKIGLADDAHEQLSITNSKAQNQNSDPAGISTVQLADKSTKQSINICKDAREYKNEYHYAKLAKEIKFEGHSTSLCAYPLGTAMANTKVCKKKKTFNCPTFKNSTDQIVYKKKATYYKPPVCTEYSPITKRMFGKKNMTSVNEAETKKRTYEATNKQSTAEYPMRIKKTLTIPCKKPKTGAELTRKHFDIPKGFDYLC